MVKRKRENSGQANRRVYLNKEKWLSICLRVSLVITWVKYSALKKIKHYLFYKSEKPQEKILLTSTTF